MDHHAILTSLHHDLVSGRRTLTDTVVILEEMRSTRTLPPGLYGELNAVAHASASRVETIADWLERFAALEG